MDPDRTLKNISQSETEPSPGSEHDFSSPFSSNSISSSVAIDAATIEPGTVLAGKYEIISVLGRGGMGTVFRVKHLMLGVELALKILDSQLLGDTSSTRRFQNEGRAAFSLQHPNLVKVHDHGILEDGHPFLVMDLVNGKTLQEILQKKGRLSLEEITPIFAQLCFALSYAHSQSVIHRDIKPANIMIVDDKPIEFEGSVKILDFGIAKIVDDEKKTLEALTMTGEIFGSPLYMSPEQCSGSAIDQRSDVYSLGCVLFEALAGSPPLVGVNPLRTMMLHVNDVAPSLKEASLGQEFPPRLEDIVAKMLAKQPSDRYGDLSAAAHDISMACSGHAYNLENFTEPKANTTCTSTGPSALLVKQKIMSTQIKLTFVQLVMLVIATVAISSLLTLLTVSVSKNRNLSSSPEVENFVSNTRENVASEKFVDIDKASANISAGMRSSFDAVDRISPVLITKGGKQFLKFNFPTKAIGHVSAGDNKIVWAEGPVLLENKEPFQLFIEDKYTPFIFESASIFQKVDPQTFNILYLIGKNFGQDPPLDGRTAEKQSAGMEIILDAAAHWTHLEVIRLNFFRITDKAYASMNLMPKLTKLAVKGCNYDAVSFARQPFFKKLTLLGLECGNIDPILNAVGSTKIKSLFLEQTPAFTPRGIESLAGAAQLSEFAVETHELTDEQFFAIANLPVHKLGIANFLLTPSRRNFMKKQHIETREQFSFVLSFPYTTYTRKAK